MGSGPLYDIAMSRNSAEKPLSKDKSEGHSTSHIAFDAKREDKWIGA